MHPNPSFRRWPDAEAVAFARRRGFGALMISEPDGPLCAHAPFLLSEDGARAEFHLVRSRPLTRALAGDGRPALIAVLGPDAYVSPDWYEDGPDHVPTWNYQAVHLRGVARLLPEEALRPHLERLSAHFEARLAPKPPWTLDKTSDGFIERLARAIAPAELEIAEIESTMKLSQNKPPAAQSTTAEAIETTPAEADLGSGAAAAVAALMRAAAAKD